MSDKSIASVGRALAAALLVEARSLPMTAEVAKLWKRNEGEIVALSDELVEAYRTEILEALRV
ncbi:hypothetical protein HAP48_0035205 [Bradyrhizobium septentrionale]|uniref:Uncharacterized protein n=1 Tax=Bradyrhizobium septentrionale TaxID=1404411 RepID=A0A973W0L9_9BRAD|nr:hypothetical protein [Bradyrhizobium septentrionale]UGY13783.1 hypothetical protein HAP48_0035205 [Bradyrhizobium septentrionale]